MGEIFKLKPVFKDNLWGGQKLITKYHKQTTINPCAESWELSCHNDGLSYVESAKYPNQTLKEVLKLHPEYLGKYSNEDGEIPILIKLIDAKQDLSIQVHPSDEYALKHENSLGKSEVWYILESDDGKLAVGFNQETSKEEIKNALDNNTICDYINYFPVNKDDFFPIEAGTVHAICAGVLLAEIQENSNITYRLFDYNRPDKEGNLRELHVDKALDVLNYQKYQKPTQQKLNYQCPYFSLTKILNEQEFVVDKEHFVCLVCYEGKGQINDISFEIGDTLFVSSDNKCQISGNFKLLKVEV